MTDDQTIHHVKTVIRWCGVYEPRPNPFTDVERYGMAFDADDLTEPLIPHARIKSVGERLAALRPDLIGKRHCNIIQSIKPVLSLPPTEPHDWDKVIQLQAYAKAANIRPDRLFDELPATLAIRLDPSLPEPATVTRRMQPSYQMLIVLAIRFSWRDLERNFRTITGQDFAE